MKGCTLPRVMTMPLSSPRRAPTASPATMPTSTGRPVESTPAITAPEKASTELTLRSIPPVRMTKVIPAAMTALMETCRAMLSRLESVRNDPLRSERMTTRIAKAMAIPNRRSTFLRRVTESSRSAAMPAAHLDSTAHPPGSRRHDSLLGGLRTWELCRDYAFVHHQDAVAHAEDLFHLRGDHHDPYPSPCQRHHQPVDLDLGADVDAARRLSHEQHTRAGLQPLGHHHLLLCPPAQVAHDLLRRRHRHVEVVHSLGDERGLLRPRDEERTQPPDDGQGDISAHAHRQHQTQPFAILGDQADAQRDSLRRRANGHPPS